MSIHKHSYYWTLGVLIAIAGIKVQAQSDPTVYQVDITDVAGRSIDQGKPVGAIAGAASVSATGSATYALPIPLPPGTNGMGPALSLNYDSRAGNGLVGMGWSLSAMSVITRVGKDHFHDNMTTPIQYGPNDRFALDGQRLVLTSTGTYGAAGTTYDTENASFSTVTAVGTFGSGPVSFTMVTKEGLTMEYGTNGSQIRTTDNLENMAWRLSRVRDAYGNTILYHYGDLDGEPLLQSITYTQNDAQSLAAYCMVSFAYSYRSDPNVINAPRRVMYQRHLIDRITINVVAPEGGTTTDHIYRSFELKYCQRDLGNSYLSEIVEFGRDNSASLNTTAIQYGEQPTGMVEGTGITIESTEKSDIHVGDYDGDGRSDILRAYYAIDPLTGVKTITRLRVYPANNGIQYDHTLPPSPYGVDMSNYGHGYYQGLVSTDMNGDGKDDICLIYTEYIPGSGYVNNYFFKKVKLFLSDDTDNLGFNIFEHDPPADSYYPSLIDPVNSIQFGDFDGDGKVELLAHCVNPNFYTTYKLYMLKDGTWVHLPVSGGDNILKNPDRLMVVDANGDRQTDLLVLNQPSNNWNAPNTCSVYSWNGSSMALVSLSSVPSATVETHPGDHEEYAVYPGDFNGDGSTDLLVHAPFASSNKWRIYFSNGTGYTTSHSGFTFTPLPAWPNDRRRIVVADMNGDGRSDVFHHHSPDANNNDLSIYYAQGHTGSAPLFTGSHMNVTNNLGFLYPCDQNGDGRHDIISFNSFDAPLRTLLIKPDGYERYLKKIANGFNAINEFTYERAVDLSFSGEPDRTYPIIRTKLPIHVVFTMSSPDGDGGTRSLGYLFGNPHVHLAGRGFLGFERISQFDDPVWTLQEHAINESHVLMLPSLTTRTDLSNYVTFQTIASAPAVTPVSAGRFMVNMPLQVTSDLLAGTKVTVDQAFDNYNNALTREVTYARISPSTTIHKEKTITEYGAFGPSAIPAKPTLITVQSTRTGAPQLSRVTKLGYNGSGSMYQRTDFFGTPGWVRTEYTFNGLGLVIGSTMVTAASGSTGGQAETYVYDPTGRFVTERQFMYHDGSTHWISTSAEYDLHRGLPKKVTGADGLSVSYGFDAFDRVNFETAPYQALPNYNIIHSLTWDLAPPHRYYRTWVQDPSRPDVTTWFDIYGRATDMRTEAFGMGANGAMSETRYDERGRVRRTTAPRIGAEPVMFQEWTYDNYDRPVSVLNSVSGTTTIGYTYSGGRTIVTTTSPAGQVTERTTDAAGMLLSAKDDGGTLSYTYDSWGNPLTVKRGASTLISNTYDSYGRQTQLWDAAAGTTQYQYDAFGRLIWQKDANTNETDFTYDNLGRLKTRNNTTWQYYYTGGKFSNVPVSITDPGTSLAYDYDVFFRRTSETRTIGGESFTTQYAYDIHDNVTSMTYPSGVAVTYTYDQNCFIDQVKRGGTTLFDAVSFNGMGQPTSYVLGDGQTTNVTYTNGLPTRYAAKGVQNLHMDYDYATGNMTYRWDAMIKRKETFTYDALDRLTSSTVATVNGLGVPTYTYPALDISYDGAVGGTTRGNITRLSNVGKFGHNGGNAVAEAYGLLFPSPPNDPPTGISLETQAITYNDRLQTVSVAEDVGGDAWLLNYQYGADGARWKSELRKNATLTETRIYAGAYEEQRITSPTTNTNKIHYVGGPAGLCAMIVVADGVETIYYTYKDHLGSVVALTTGSGTLATVVLNRSYDPWGRERHATTWNGTPAASPFQWTYRGFTGHEHVAPFGLINMNARMYDPVVGRMLAADNYVHPVGSQGFNRYAYALNNPLKYTDPSGEVAILVPIIIGAVIGTYMGGTLANNNYNPVEWDWNSGKTWGYMGAGLLVGASSGYIGGAVAASGMPVANTVGIASASFVNSMGTSMYTGGQTDVSISFGIASYNFDKKEWGNLGRKGNNTLENIGYGLGALANVADVLAGFQPGDVQLNTEKSDATGHSAITNVGEIDPYNSIVSVGPDPGGKWIFNPFKFKKGTNNWNNYVDAGDDVMKVSVKGVNVRRLQNYGEYLDKGVNYNLFFSSCVTHAARALTLSGVPTLGIHPYILHAQMYLRSIGVRPMMFSHYLYQY
jgi:RHS repeat-associated protein